MSNIGSADAGSQGAPSAPVVKRATWGKNEGPGSYGQLKSGATGPNDYDPKITSVRGRADDLIQMLSVVRNRVTINNAEAVGKYLDDADEFIEAAASEVSNPE